MPSSVEPHYFCELQVRGKAEADQFRQLTDIIRCVAQREVEDDRRHKEKLTCRSLATKGMARRRGLIRRLAFNAGQAEVVARIMGDDAAIEWHDHFSYEPLHDNRQDSVYNISAEGMANATPILIRLFQYGLQQWADDQRYIPLSVIDNDDDGVPTEIHLIARDAVYSRSSEALTTALISSTVGPGTQSRVAIDPEQTGLSLIQAATTIGAAQGEAAEIEALRAMVMRLSLHAGPEGRVGAIEDPGLSPVIEQALAAGGKPLGLWDSRVEARAISGNPWRGDTPCWPGSTLDQGQPLQQATQDNEITQDVGTAPVRGQP